MEHVTDVLSDVLAALHDGRSAREVCCLHLARLLGATSAAYVRISASRRLGSVTCWPSADGDQRTDFETDECAAPWGTAQGERESPADAWMRGALWRQSVAFSELTARLNCGELAGVPLACSRHEARLAVFGTREGFDDRQTSLLQLMSLRLVRLDGQLSRLEDHRDAPPSSLPGREPLLEQARLRARQHGLTPREFEVLRMLSLGLSARSIATRLAVSPRTVHKHLGSIYDKLGSHDRLLAVRRAGALGLLPAVGQLAK